MNYFKGILLVMALVASHVISFAQDLNVTSPDQKLMVKLYLNEGKLYYNVTLQGKEMIERSPLGLRGSQMDLSSGLKLIDKQLRQINEHYNEPKIKISSVNYQANELICKFENAKKNQLEVTFRVSNNNIAFRYQVPQTSETANFIIEEELSGYKFPANTTTFLTPQATPMIGWMKTKPSYEEEYTPDQAMGVPSKYGVGYTFPALFHLGNEGWVLLSETGVNSLYCGSKLSEGTKDGNYKIAFPEPGENNGMGRANPTIPLPGHTPWRTITVGTTLKPVAETTIPFDVVEPQYQASKQYTFGRSTWSWLLWQDPSIKYDDQKTFIDLAASMGYEFALIDGGWEKNIGYKKIEELIAYAKTKGVGICLWYNSNGFWNDAPQDPKSRMNTASARKQEMAWMQRMGVKGIKVDFFGGDKQETMKLYEDILSDANTFGLTVIFHGCTIPRGWERMYPNYVGSEAVLASENLIFGQHANDNEAFNASLHPFIRNAVGAMEFGPVLLNKRHNKTNDGGTIRKTTETFQIATAVLFQSPVQNFGITPNNLTDVAPHVIDFMKKVPTTWDNTVFIDGYPGKYCVLARRHGDTWYVAAINAETTEKTINISLPMLSGTDITLYTDADDRSPQIKQLKLNKTKQLKVKLLPGGANVIVAK
ncbi:glycoside hydrolase family 97 catalytic domain-containing protein [Pedobacter sp. PF22-3]|uniref:glycoside hydrolase family 97 protein n=1 Tax=Pedobacter sp. PF22-3 TaxID=2994467 RepID=UPI002247AA38|nr:glycoside hydrolase family 97 protein [Pedobacter sp. PF22-3]MCX2492733.1 glycoside hydrolase family 97 catalytic domain-containing protein [Pedobacter sp. PF22-3]